MLSKSIGSNIKHFRIEKALSQEELAEKLFVTRQTVSNYEIGKSNPDIDMLQKIAAALEVELTWLLYGKPVQEERKADIRSLLIVTVVFLFVSILTLVLNIYTNALRTIGIAMPNIFVHLAFFPACFIMLGIWTIKMLDSFLGIGKIKGKVGKTGKIITYCFLGLNLFFSLPVFVYCIIFLLEKTSKINHLFLFIKNLPVYKDFSAAFFKLMYYHPYVYIMFGIALYLFCLSKKQYK